MHAADTNLAREYPDTTDTVPFGCDPTDDDSDYPDFEAEWRWTDSQVAAACGISAVVAAFAVWVL